MFKTEAPSVPVVVLSGYDDVGDKVLLFELGADDYITKPFSPKELLARLQRALQRGNQVRQVLTPEKEVDQHDLLTFGSVRIDFTSFEASRAGERVSLTAHEVKLLKYFARFPDTVISRETLLTELWRVEGYRTTRTVDTFMFRLRQKLEPNPASPRYFLTIYRGGGYKFSTTGSTAASE